MKLPLDRFDIGKNVGVIEFQIIQHGDLRPVVDKFRTLVEKSRVVLICLDHEGAAGAQTGGDAEILGYAADQESGLLSCGLKNPREHTRGSGFAVGAGAGQYRASGQYLLGQPLGTGGISESAVQHGFHLRVPPGKRVADQHQIGPRL